MTTIDKAAEFLRENSCGGLVPRVGIVLGSGLGAVADRLESPDITQYGAIPGFPQSSVAGHAGRLCVGEMDGVPTAVMQGRVHLYEGHPVADVVRPIRTLVRMGVKKLIITNAAGGIDPSFSVGDLMLISDHLNLTGANPLVGKNDPDLGARFPDMSDAYSNRFRALAQAVSDAQGTGVVQGVYAGLLGPSYETPAEIRMLGVLGANAVGMSTVLEVIAAHHMGAEIVGLSVISNAAAGLGTEKLSHDEVKAAADAVQDKLTGLIAGMVVAIDAA